MTIKILLEEIDIHYQIHTYSNCQCSSGSWTSSQPMRNSPSDYNLDKPIIIGEFSAVCSGRIPIMITFGFSDMLKIACVNDYFKMKKVHKSHAK